MKKWFNYIIKGIVVILCLLLVWRVMFAEDKSTLDELVPTDSTAELYKANDSLKVLTHDVVDEISDGGYFSAYAMYYTPETKELQVTVRYNDSTVEQLGDIGFYAYTVDTSATPAETETATGDEAETSGERLHNGYPIGDILTPETAASEEKLFYNYEKLVFEGIEIGEHTNVIISLCSAGDENSEHAVISVHFAEQPLEEYKLSKDEKAALSSYEG